jgi:hypothetical protein
MPICSTVRSGLEIVDVSNPSAPTLAAHYTPSYAATLNPADQLLSAGSGAFTANAALLCETKASNSPQRS